MDNPSLGQMYLNTLMADLANLKDYTPGQLIELFKNTDRPGLAPIIFHLLHPEHEVVMNVNHDDKTLGMFDGDPKTIGFLATDLIRQIATEHTENGIQYAAILSSVNSLLDWLSETGDRQVLEKLVQAAIASGNHELVRTMAFALSYFTDSNAPFAFVTQNQATIQAGSESERISLLHQLTEQLQRRTH